MGTGVDGRTVCGHMTSPTPNFFLFLLWKVLLVCAYMCVSVYTFHSVVHCETDCESEEAGFGETPLYRQLLESAYVFFLHMLHF